MNIQYSNNPGYVELVTGIYRNFDWYFRDQYWRQEKACHSNLLINLAEYFQFSWDDIHPVVYSAIVFTFIRYAFESIIYKVNH